MPLVYINMMEGRDPQKIEDMTKAVSEAIATTLPAPLASIRVMVHEMAEHQYAVGGKPMRIVRQERASAEKTQ